MLFSADNGVTPRTPHTPRTQVFDILIYLIVGHFRDTNYSRFEVVANISYNNVYAIELI